MPMGEKHKGVLVCECGKNIISVFAGGKKIDGFGYCGDCNKMYRLGIKELGEDD